MRVIDRVELGRLENFEMTSLFAMKQTWKEGQTFTMREPRNQSALLWFGGGAGKFVSKDGRVVTVSRGALVSIPQGAEYSVTFSSCEKPTTLLLEFCLFSDGEPFALSSEIEVFEPALEDRRVIDILERLVSEYVIPQRPWLSVKSGIYKLLYLLSCKEERRVIARGSFSAIEKGIRYLETDGEQKCSIEEIAEMCFVTPAYFRRLFRAYAGISPAAYRTKQRIERAKELMERSDLSVAELSELLGYESPSYFCRVFKKETGIAPSEYRKSIAVLSIEK